MTITYALALTALSVALRLVPHAPNVAPIGALALFAGVYLPRRWGWTLPLLAMLASDWFIGFYDIGVMMSVYLSFAAIAAMGWVVRRRYSVPAIMAGSLAGSTLFYVVTNFAVWVNSDWYPHTLPGLLAAYTLALPFFRNTLIGDGLFTALVFSGYALLVRLRPRVAPREAPVPVEVLLAGPHV